MEFIFRAGKFAIDETSFSEIPLNGKGHFYIKNWKFSFTLFKRWGNSLGKPYKSYPRVSHNGELLLYCR